MPNMPWAPVSPTATNFKEPPREYGILPFWFLNGELDPDEMRYQLREFRDKGMPGIILHARFGLELRYLGSDYLERIQFAVEEAERIGLKTWIYDEMNWPSGTADFRVLRERPDLAQRYLECISFPVRGPWFAYLTGGDSRYLDFERSTPVAAFALGENGEVIDLTPNLSFENVIPWEAPPGNWRMMYIVEKRAEYYIDALDPESTREFLRIGYEPYAETVGSRMPGSMVGFYTDEPAMHYYVTGGDNPIVPWTKDMFRRFQERNGYNLRPRLPDLFFEVGPDSPRVRHDFYETLTAFYADAYFRQIHEWCRERDVLFTGHLLFEELLRRMVRVAGNPFKHYPHMDVVGVDHLYPFIGSRDRPDEHVAMKLASSAAHQQGSDRLLCESFGGIFMDATMQRMKWITDWEYVLGVNLLNPHGFHYTLEGPRKRDWPPSMFYQYPWWHAYDHFSTYVSRLSHMLTGGVHIAKVAVLWPINTIFGSYIPQTHTPHGDRTEQDFNALTDLLLRLHHDYDYLDEDVLTSADVSGGRIRVSDEIHELLILPPMTHIKLSTVERLEQFVESGGRVLGMVFLPDRAFTDDGQVDIAGRIEALFGVNPTDSQRQYRSWHDMDIVERDHPSGGKSAFIRGYALARKLPMRIQQALGVPGSPDHSGFGVEANGDQTLYWFTSAEGSREEITSEVNAERQAVAAKVHAAIAALIEPDVIIDNPEVFCLHRVKEGRDLYFFVNSTHSWQSADVTVTGDVFPLFWDTSTGNEQPVAPARWEHGSTSFRVELPPVGSAFVIAGDHVGPRVTETNVIVDSVGTDRLMGHARGDEGHVILEQDGQRHRLTIDLGVASEPLLLDGDWEFEAIDANALVIGRWLAMTERPGTDAGVYAAPEADTAGWLAMVPGAWSYQLPTEPETPYPIHVWYRAKFHVQDLPTNLNLLVDGFAGSDWTLYVNGEQPVVEPVRSDVDSEIAAMDIVGLARAGENTLALRLTVTSATDGLLDLIKLTGDFSLHRREDEDFSIAAPRTSMRPASWTDQGYPFYSGQAIYRRQFRLPDDFAGQRIEVDPTMNDDVVEVVVNGQAAGVRLWEPYTLDISPLLQPGDNTLELRVANTLINLLEAVPRPSGLAGPPRLVPYRRYVFDMPG
jgi:hypothetical protein